VALTNEPNIRGGRPLANRQPVANRDGEQKLKWVLGNPPSGEHCDVCLARAGQVKTAREWAAMKAPPCNCHCSLEPVDDAAANRWSDVARAASLAVRRAKAAKRSALLREFESSKVEGAGTGSVSRGDAETQRRKAAREAVMRELAEKRSTLK
jgi:hypothetical protein